ncbi:MazG-like nucleotide pyrophosphohydrolase family protein [Bacillus oleivorans]|uniref:MazG-like nucleotide pyrophosphohydrolase family protein n=1 Tax=Bacillus oleivorans TaxID=1448271 RepID=A0A285CMI3_9BACI|nr:MazG-like family protein [Bacillus oleivorans]SNX68625.1 MazG-like nucleotide pyrophosphohydrolase family protein [Bacillus oleivorans]
MRIAELQQDVKKFSEEKGFSNTTIEERTIFLVTEVGEVAKEVLHIIYESDTEKMNKLKEKLGLELYDVVWNVIELANKLDIDLEDAFRKKREINKHRQWV